MRNLQIEALFGGVLALIVIAVGVYAVTNAGVTGAAHSREPIEAIPIETDASLKPLTLDAKDPSDLVCECYHKAFSLASKKAVVSPEFRTGFEQCRARAGVNGGQAWSAGWDARLNAKPFEASCRSYRRRMKAKAE